MGLDAGEEPGRAATAGTKRWVGGSADSHVRIPGQATRHELSSQQEQTPGAWGSRSPPRTEEGGDPKELENLPVRRKGVGSAPSPSSSPPQPSLRHPPGVTPRTRWPLPPWGVGLRGGLPVPTVPDGPLVRVVHLVALHGVGVGVTGALLLVPHGVLVDGGVGLGGGVVRRRDAVAGLAAVVAVPVIHRAVGVVVCEGRQGVGQGTAPWLPRPGVPQIHPAPGTAPLLPPPCPHRCGTGRAEGPTQG